MAPRDVHAPADGVVRKVVNGIVHLLYMRTCPTGITYAWIPQVSPPGLAQQASNSIYGRLPFPQPGVAPPPTAGVVNVGMWYWTDPSTWRNISVTAWVPTPAGIVWARTTARPTALVYTPGDGTHGTGTTSCTGPGHRWLPDHGDDTPSACMYTYRHTSLVAPSGRFDATVSIVWNVTWTSNRSRGGTLPSYVTTTSVPIRVGEIQALVSR